MAGSPASYFYRPSLDDWTNRLGVKTEAPTERELIWDIIHAALAKGRGATSVFGLRQQRPSFEFLCEKLSLAIPEVSTDRARIETAFGKTLFIHLSREDKLEQAVSLIKAQQTGLWHVGTDGTEIERTGPAQHPVYDGEEIKRQIETLTAYGLRLTTTAGCHGSIRMGLLHCASHTVNCPMIREERCDWF